MLDPVPVELLDELLHAPSGLTVPRFLAADAAAAPMSLFLVGVPNGRAVQPELAPILEPAAAVAKGVGWAAKLF